MSKKLIAKSILDGLTLAAAIIAGVCLWAGRAEADPAPDTSLQGCIGTVKRCSQTPTCTNPCAWDGSSCQC